MAQSSIARRLASPGARFDPIVGTVLKKPEAIDEVFEALASETAKVKYGAAKVLRIVSERAPELLYPRFDDLLRLFEGSNTIHRWGATIILGNLAGVDRENRIERVLDRLLAPIRAHELIGAGNAIAAAASIAVAKPELADRIASAILYVERATYATPECRNIAIGHAIRALDRFFRLIQQRQQVTDFVARQRENPRAATRKKAADFLRRWANA